MINMSECFSMIGLDGCNDVATSMVMQGTDPDISIPVYGPFFCHLLAGERTNFLASNLPEFNAIRKLAINCGAVAASINLLEADILTLAGVLMIFTPNTGMNVFVKNNTPELVNLAEDLIEALIRLTPFADSAHMIAKSNIGGIELASKALEWLIELFIDKLNCDMENMKINLHNWDEIPEYYNYVINSGEMNRMAYYRNMMNAVIL